MKIKVAGGLVGLMVLMTAGLWAFTATPDHAVVLEEGLEMVVYQSPTCGCCTAWVDHVREAGIEVDVQLRDWGELNRIMAEHGVTPEIQSCHLGVIGGYAVVGHVPADVVRKLLAERPDVAGLAVPGMPIGSPGMEQGDRKDAYDVLTFTADGRTRVYERR